ncbi:hypothetical protein [Nitrososphaeria virus YSH_1032793]|uniref:Uncharacterized protein n=1 Tax=Nitrososphaeria virus YSH_1032793 TaxID=3071320 RepID=A0A976UAC6_9CAUD|nr:hypothetical protein QKV91_gp32 [Yangshan Harbor Nitrososphaeria virus]UVF62236.1 hypothetical protein [Nitrososphaeria virus YSH_1032793]
MTQTYSHLTGSWEEITKTLANWFNVKWTDVVGYPTEPYFYDPSSFGSEVTKAYPNGVKNYGVFFNEGDTIEDFDFHTVDDSVVAYKTDIIIDTNFKLPSESSAVRRHMNSIINEFYPNGNRRVLKSNGTQDSAIAYFKDNVLSWRPDNSPKEIKIFNGVHHQSILEVIYFVSRS